MVNWTCIISSVSFMAESETCITFPVMMVADNISPSHGE